MTWSGTYEDEEWETGLNDVFRYHADKKWSCIGFCQPDKNYNHLENGPLSVTV